MFNVYEKLLNTNKGFKAPLNGFVELGKDLNGLDL